MGIVHQTFRELWIPRGRLKERPGVPQFEIFGLMQGSGRPHPNPLPEGEGVLLPIGKRSLAISSDRHSRGTGSP